MSKIAFGELLGFAGLEIGNGVRDDAFDSRVGAKVGKEPEGQSAVPSDRQDTTSNAANS